MSDLTDLYQEVILDHNRRPRNWGPLTDATRVAKGHNPLCGDRLTLYVKVEGATDAAARAGLREGDVILAVGNTEVGSLKEFDGALNKADKSKPISMLFRRGDWAQYALVRPAR